ncbi:MAG TPA: hypothetical protein VJ901_04730 [Thermoanaerobaculia bacterium]|nr:hypothetical protein [Thermoanaerobaculia bacterium]
MRYASLLLFSFASALFARAESRLVAFDPPDPTSRTPVLAHVHIPNYSCGIDHTTVSRDGSSIRIAVFVRQVECIRASNADFTVDLGVLPAGIYGVSIVHGEQTSEVPPIAAIAVRDANPPFELRPNAGASGADIISIIGPNMIDTTAVRFGPLAAEIVSLGFGGGRVKSPALAPGIYDVTIEKPSGTLHSTAAYGMPDPESMSIPAEFYERVLLPVFWSGPGAFGAQWATNAAMYNGNEYPITPAFTSVFLSSCVPSCDRRPAANGTTSVVANANALGGVVEELPRQAMPRLDLALNIRDTSRDAQDLGSQVPVVRESDLFARPFSILNVPNDPRYRVTLRLYSLTGRGEFTVRIYRGDTQEPAVKTFVVLTPQASLRGGAFASIDNLLAGYRQLDGATAVRVEIDPIESSGNKSAWGFVSVTNNDTQHVTVISPQ